MRCLEKRQFLRQVDDEFHMKEEYVAFREQKLSSMEGADIRRRGGDMTPPGDMVCEPLHWSEGLGTGRWCNQISLSQIKVIKGRGMGMDLGNWPLL